ncbi:MAG: hypothetical protein ACSLE3_07225, partial [Microbacteriaceae bacterium]
QFAFLSEAVDPNLTLKGGTYVMARDGDGVIQYSASNDNIYTGTHGFGTGQVVRYYADGTTLACSGASSGAWTGCVGGRLVDGGYYRVIVQTNESIQLADLADTFPYAAISIGSSGATGTHRVYRAIYEPIATSGNTYWVVRIDNDHIQLRTRPSGDPSGSLLALSDQVTIPTFLSPVDRSGDHVLTRVVGLTGQVPAGTVHRLTIDLTGTGNGVLVGVGGPKSLIGSATDEVSTAASSGFGVGAISVRNSKSYANATADIRTQILGGTLRAMDVLVNATSIVNTAFVSANSGGGFIDVGDSQAYGDTSNVAMTTVASGANIVAGRDASILATMVNYANGESNTNGGGFFASAYGDTRLFLDAVNVVQISGRVFAVRTLLAEARHGMNLRDRSVADTGGLGADVDANDTTANGIHVDSVNTVELTGSARLFAANAYLWSYQGLGHRIVLDGSIADDNLVVGEYRAWARSDADATALGADSDAGATVAVYDLTEVILRSGAEVTSFDRADLRAVHTGTDLDAIARADCSCGGGDTDARSFLDYLSSTRISAEDSSVIRTAVLWAETYQVASGNAYNRDADSDGGFLDGGSEEHNGNTSAQRFFFWEATVILLGEPNPVLVVDASGTIVAQTRNVYVRAYDPVAHTYSGPLGVGAQIAVGQWIVVGDLVYDEGGTIHFQANNVGSLGPDSQILGNAGAVQIKHTWDSVLISNSSSRRLVVNDIDVVLLETFPVMEVSVGGVPDVAGSFNLSAQEQAVQSAVLLMMTAVNAYIRTPIVAEAGAPQTFDFDVTHKFAPTDVQVLNVVGAASSDLWLDGDIENPIGRTEIRNERGGIFADDGLDLDGIESTGVDANLVSVFARPGADADYELVRTNQFFIDSDTASVGRQLDGAGPRVAIAVELIRFRHIDPEYCGATPVPCLFEVLLQADAAGDMVLDITANERSLTAHAASLAWQIDRIIAGNDVDVVVNDTIQGTDTPSVNGLQVFLFTPDNGRGDPPSGSPIGGWPQTFQYHFRPDVPVVDYSTILRAFGIADRTRTTSTYTFGDAGGFYGDLRAGDDLTVCHVASRNYLQASDESTAPVYPCDTRDPSTLAYPLGLPATTIHFVAFVDEAASLPYPVPVEDDDGIGTDVPQLFLFTNGNITATELVGDMLVGHIHSSNGDVTLYSPMRILDADGQPTIDVTGINITLHAGLAGGIGGIGLSTDFLEINTSVLDSTWDNAADGVLKAYDTVSDEAQTEGIYLDELVGDLPLFEVFTAGSSSLATGNVSARTLKGSVLNARLDDGDNIRAQSVDIDANGGTIGLQSKDVVIDSGRAPPFDCDNLNCSNNLNGTSDAALATAGDDVALEATGGIYLTESDAYLRLVLAHSLTGDIRLTVRESAQTDEDLYLISSGSARFAESNTRLPNSDI